jgi:3-methyladenine DNA glycosylase/8-oxoguanine DNA glycosylase
MAKTPQPLGAGFWLGYASCCVTTSAAPRDERMLEGVVRTALPVDLRATLAPMKHGPLDPTCGADERGVWWRATRTPAGPATTSFASLKSNEVRVCAWGPGAEWAIGAAADAVGSADSLDGFAPSGIVATLHAKNPGLRIGRTRAVFEAMAPYIVEQLVTSYEAHVGWGRLVHAWSERAPGPRPLWLPPAPAAFARRAYWEMRPFGLNKRRADTLRRAAMLAARLEEASALPMDAAYRRMRAIPGIGPWTAAHVAMTALGDADAVAVGDFHLPGTVGLVLAGERDADDARMLELLAPYAGHRGRVVRLLMEAGARVPRRAPRKRLRGNWA